MNLILCILEAEDDSVRSRGNTDDLEKIEENLPQSNEGEKSMNLKWEDGKLRTLSGHIVSCQGKNVRINIPLTTPSQTLSEISYLVMEDLLNQSSRKCNQEGGMIHLNKTRLHHAEKMIKGGFIELYKGLGYLNDYRYDSNFLSSQIQLIFGLIIYLVSANIANFNFNNELMFASSCWCFVGIWTCLHL